MITTGGVAARRVATTITMVAGIATLVFLALSIAPIAAAFGYLSPAYSIVAVAFVFGFPAVLALVCRRLSLTQLKRSLGGYAIGFAVVVLAWIPATVSSPLPPGVAPWPLEITALATVPAAIAWRPPAAWAYLVANSILIAPVRLFASAGEGVSTAFQFAFFTIAFSAIFTALAIVAMKRGAALDEANSRGREQAVRAAALAATTQEHARLDALVHDEVTGTLYYASRPETQLTASVQTQAARALTQLEQVRGTPAVRPAVSGAPVSATSTEVHNHYLGLTGVGAVAMIWGYFSTMAVLAVWTLDRVHNVAPTLVGLALFGVVCAAVTRDRLPVLSYRTTWLVIAAWPIIAILVSWQLDDGVRGEARFEQWYFGAGTVALFFIGLRGRPLWSWVGFIALSAVILVWGATTDVGLVAASGLVAKQLPIVIVGTLFAIGLSRTTASIERISSEASTLASIEAASNAIAEERRRAIAQLDSFATPLLSRIAGGGRLTKADRVEFGIAEAELRDSVRARSLSVAPIIVAARDARRRGVEVVLLDDSDARSANSDDLDEVVARISAALRSATKGRVTARLLPSDRMDVATLVIDDGLNPSYQAIARRQSSAKKPATV